MRTGLIGKIARSVGATPSETSRREFLKGTLAGAGLLLSGCASGAGPSGPRVVIVGAGFAGLDLTLRPGGHVAPGHAEMGLAEARRVADAAGVAIPMISTAVTDTDSPHADAIFAAVAKSSRCPDQHVE